MGILENSEAALKMRQPRESTARTCLQPLSAPPTVLRITAREAALTSRGRAELSRAAWCRRSLAKEQSIRGRWRGS